MCRVERFTNFPFPLPNCHCHFQFTITFFHLSALQISRYSKTKWTTHFMTIQVFCSSKNERIFNQSSQWPKNNKTVSKSLLFGLCIPNSRLGLSNCRSFKVKMKIIFGKRSRSPKLELDKRKFCFQPSLNKRCSNRSGKGGNDGMFFVYDPFRTDSWSPSNSCSENF